MEQEKVLYYPNLNPSSLPFHPSPPLHKSFSKPLQSVKSRASSNYKGARNSFQQSSEVYGQLFRIMFLNA